MSPAELLIQTQAELKEKFEEAGEGTKVEMLLLGFGVVARIRQHPIVKESLWYQPDEGSPKELTATQIEIFRGIAERLIQGERLDNNAAGAEDTSRFSRRL